jgi:glycosyltransferase involved in cell wall biosynthesis
MPCKILFAGTYPNVAVGYSKVAHFLTTCLANHESVELVYFGFSNFPGASKVNRKFHPKIKYIDVYDEEHTKYPSNPDTYGSNIFIETLINENPNIVFLYNDIIVVSRLLNKVLEFRQNNIQAFKVYTHLDLVYDCERPEYLRHVFNLSDKVVLFTDYWKSHLCKLGFPESKMSLLYLAVEDTKFSKLDSVRSKRELGLAENSFIILNANRNSYRKAIDLTIRSFLLFLKQQHMNPTLFLLLHTQLDSEYGYNLINVIESECLMLGMNYNEIINKRILQLKNNPVEDETMNLLYNACDIGINTCIGEGFGLCNAEHCLVGKPQVVTSVGGLKDIFKDTMALVQHSTSYHIPNQTDGHNGIAYVCKPEDIANKLSDIFNNYQACSKYFECVSSSIKTRYSSGVVQKQLYDLFDLK